MKQPDENQRDVDAPTEENQSNDADVARAQTQLSEDLEGAARSARGSAVASGSLAPPSGRVEGVDALVGRVLAERYRIVQLLGVGGMGAVYQAEHVHMRKPVALKVLHQQLTHLEDVVARFEREAIAAANIGNPHVAAATDFGRLEDGSFYLVLEYLSGKSLASLIKAGPLPTERALAIGVQISRALEAAHAANIVHRDLKPDNVMLIEKEGQQDYVKVLDFGIAKVPVDAGRPGANLTRVGVVFGTPGYMSPEQSVGQAVDHRTDLYALGVILYEMLAGRLPFPTQNLPELLAKQISAAPPPLPSHVPDNVSALVVRLLDKDAEARPKDATEVASLLEQLQHEKPTVGGTSIADVSREQQPTRTRRLMAMVGAVVLVLGVGLGAVSMLTPRRATEHAGVRAANRAEGPGSRRGATTTDQVAMELATRAALHGVPTLPKRGAAPMPARQASAASSAQKAETATETSAQAERSTPTRRGKQQKDRPKRRTGPGGIYIPPPSEWF